MSTTDAPSGELPRGGAWERQITLGGERLRETFASGEAFVLWGLEVVGEVAVDEGDGVNRMVDKTVLQVSRLTEPEKRFQVGTLSSAIATLAGEAKETDFPVEAYWMEVQTKRGLSPATVIQAVRPWIDPAE